MQGGGGVKATYNYGDMLTVEADGHISASDKDGLSRLGKRTQDRLQESVVKATTRVKASRTTKITETQESGREERVTRRLKNVNKCHALTINYFDVHASYDVTTSFLPDETRLCVLIDNPIAYTFVDDNDRLVVRTHETVLRAALIDQALVDGFGAIRQIEARRIAQGLIDAADARQKADAVQALQDAGQATGTSEVAQAESTVKSMMAGIGAAAAKVNQGSFEALMRAVDGVDESVWRPQLATLGDSARDWIFARLFGKQARSLYQACLDLAGLSDTTILNSADGLNTAITSSMLDPDSLLNPTPSTIDTLLTPLVQAHYNSTPEWAWWWGFFVDNDLRSPDDAGLLTSLDSFRSAYQSLISARAQAALAGGNGGPIDQTRIEWTRSRETTSSKWPSRWRIPPSQWNARTRRWRSRRLPRPHATTRS